MIKGTTPSLELVKLCCRALLEKKAEDVRVLEVTDQSSITDYLVIATGNSEPHLRALRVELARALAAVNGRMVGVDTSQESGWTVVDIFDVMVHLFSPETRVRYALESLWRDAVEVPVAGLLAIKKPKAKAKAKAEPKTKAKPKPKPKKAAP